MDHDSVVAMIQSERRNEIHRGRSSCRNPQDERCGCAGRRCQRAAGIVIFIVIRVVVVVRDGLLDVFLGDPHASLCLTRKRTKPGTRKRINPQNSSRDSNEEQVAAATANQLKTASLLLLLPLSLSLSLSLSLTHTQAHNKGVSVLRP